MRRLRSARAWGCPGLPTPPGGRRVNTAPSAIEWLCPSGRRFPLPGPRFGSASRWAPGHVWRFGPLAGSGVHSLAELQGGLSGLRSRSHGRECRLEPGVPHPVCRRFCLFPRRSVGGVPPGAAADLVVHLVDVGLRSVCRANRPRRSSPPGFRAGVLIVHTP